MVTADCCDKMAEEQHGEEVCPLLSRVDKLEHLREKLRWQSPRGSE